MSITRIRKRPLRHEVEDRLGDARSTSEEELASEVLGRALTARLNAPEVQPTGYELGDDYHVDAGLPATAFPNDTFPKVFEGLLRRYTREADRVGYLFCSSRAPFIIAEQMGRSVYAADEYNTYVQNLPCGHLLNSGMLPTERVDLLYIHCPLPGVVDRKALFDPTGENDLPNDRLYWESMDEKTFVTAMADLIEMWTHTVEPGGVLALQVGWCRWGKEWILPWPQLHEAAYKEGWRLVRRHRLHMQVRPGPVQGKSLTDGHLLIYRKSPEVEEVKENRSAEVRTGGGSQ